MTKSLTLTNIILDASQLVSYSDTTCKTSKHDCCQQDPSTLLFSSTSAGADTLCTMNNGPPTSTSNRKLPPTYNDSTYQTTYGLPKPNGFFNMQFLSDYTSAAVPLINITNCEIRNFFYHAYAASFISLSRSGGKVIIQNTIFDNFMLPYGLISNGFTKQDRDLSNQTSYSGTHCKIINPDANYDYCHSITIRDSTFTNYNKQQFLLNTVDGFPEILNEGMVLFITNVFGPIVIQNNTFKNMSSILQIPGNTDSTSYQCADMYSGGNGTSPNGLGALRDQSPYKLDIDRHIDLYTSSMINSTGAVFNIKNVTQGLIFYNNTFDSIIGMTGSALYLAGFNNTLTAPIILQNNTFSNSFVYAFGLTVVIWARQGNYASAACYGVHLRDNIFNNNFGCPGAYGNVIISCLTIAARTSGYYTTSITEDAYYKKLNTAMDPYEFGPSSVYWLLFRYTWGNYTSGLVSYNVINPLDGYSINCYQISVVNNIFSNNFAVISNGLAVVGAKDLNVSGNTFVNNSIPILENYQQNSGFTSNAFYTLLGSQIPNIPSESIYNFPRASSPLLTKALWNLQVINTNFINNYASGSSDLYMGAAITSDRNIGFNDVIIFNCTFEDHKGFPQSMSNSNRGLYAYNSHPLVSVNFASNAFDSYASLWIYNSLTYERPTQLRNITNINFTSCIVKNNYFQLTTTNGYYLSDSQFPDKLSWILNYYPDSTRYQTSIASDLIRNASNSWYTFVVDIGVLISQISFINNIDYSGLCWFHPLLFKNYYVRDSVFRSTNQAVNINLVTGNPASLICYLPEPVIEGYTSNRHLVISGLNFSDVNATIILIHNRYQSSGGTSITFNNIRVNGTYNNVSSLVLIMNLDIMVTIIGFYVDTGYTKNGIFQFSKINGGSVSLSDIYISNMQAESSAILQANDAVLHPISRLRVSNCKHFDYVLSANRTQNALAPSTMIALINITSSTIPITDFVFMGVTSIHLYYALSSVVLLRGGLVSNTTSIYDLINTRKSHVSVSSIHFNEVFCNSMNCTTGVFSSFSDTISIKSSVFYNNSALTALLSYSRLSTINLQDSIVANNSVQRSGSGLVVSVGTINISNSVFQINLAQEYGLVIGIRSMLTILNTVFLQNDAAEQVKNLYIRSGALNLKDSLFFNSKKNSPTISDFILSQDGNITAENTGFYGGLANSGAINFAADIAVANFTNCTFKDNTAYQMGGAISQNGYMYISRTNFVNNTAYINGTNIHAESHSTLSLSQVSFSKSANITLHLIDMKSLSVDSSVLDGESTAQGIYCEGCLKILITNSHFAYFSGGICGSVLQVYHPATLVVSNVYTTVNLNIINSTFETNKVNPGMNIPKGRGGAICLDSEDTTIIYQGAITNSKFLNNFVNNTGGAIYYKCLPKACTMEVSNSVFKNNTATAAGGAIFFEIQPVVFTTESTFSGNNAPYGPNSGAYPVAISLLPSNSTSRRNLQDLSGYNIVSGQPITPPLRFAVVDEFDQIYTPDNSSTLTVSAANSSVQFLSSRIFTAVEGVYTLDSFTMETGINSDFTLLFSSNGITQVNRSLMSIPTLSIQTHFRDCIRGERISDDSRQCISCSASTYSLAKHFNTSCKTCDTNLDCFGGDIIGPQPGYWRFSSWTQTSQSCPGNGCVGYYRPENATWEGWCKEQHNATFCYTGWCNYSAGTMGNLCAECRDGFAPQSLTGDCIDCGDNTLNIVYTVGFLVVAVIAIIWIIRKATKEKDEEDLDEDEDDRLDTILLRVFTNYIQMISIISSFPMNWPGQLTNLFQQYNRLSTSASQIFSLDCFLQSSVFSRFSIKSFFLKVVVTSIVPLLIIIFSILVWITIYILRFKIEGTERRFKKVINKVITSIIVLLFMIHSNVVYVSITALRCTNIGDPASIAYDPSDLNAQYYLEADTSVECWTPEHKAFAFGFAIPSFVFWGKSIFKNSMTNSLEGVGIPILAFFVIRANRFRLRDPDVLGRYGFIYDGYDSKYYYW